MSTLMEMVRSGFHPVRKALELPEHTPEQIEDLLHCCVAAANQIDCLWSVISHALDQGIERRKLDVLLKEAKEAVEESLGFNRRLAKITSENATLRELEQRSGVVLARIEKLLAWLEAPRDTVDVDKFRKRGERPTAEDCKNLDAILARLASGEDL